MTQANYTSGNYSNTSGDTATTYCAELTLGGYSDWRFPSIEELESIVDYAQVSPAIDPVFINALSSYYWSSTTFAAGTPNYAWVVTFSNGDGNYLNKDNNLVVRCVR